MPRYIVLLTLLVSLTPASQAQGLSPLPGNEATLYRFNDNASYEETCFAPCECPAPVEVTGLRGTFALGPAMPGNVVDFRSVAQLLLTARRSDGTALRIAGEGVYKVTNFSPDPDQSLDLRLSIDGAAPRYFFSDFVPATPGLPEIDVQVSMNGLVCQDTIIRVSASPVPEEEISRYRLIDGSTYQQGCFDPCDCILEEPRPMVGGFALVPLLDFGTYAEFAVVGTRFGAPGAAGDPPIRLTGPGRYFLVQGFAGPLHAMGLTLKLNGSGPVRFDQELANAPTFFPDIDISLDMNEMVCFDRILKIHARPLSLFP